MDTLEYQPGTNPPVPMIQVLHQFRPGRYLMRETDRGPLREFCLMELSPTHRRARVLWEMVPVDQEWVDADTLWGKTIEALDGTPYVVASPTQGRAPVGPGQTAVHQGIP